MNLLNKKIALIQGGDSIEREISVMTSQCVQNAFKELKLHYNIFEADFS